MGANDLCLTMVNFKAIFSKIIKICKEMTEMNTIDALLANEYEL